MIMGSNPVDKSDVHSVRTVNWQPICPNHFSSIQLLSDKCAHPKVRANWLNSSMVPSPSTENNVSVERSTTSNSLRKLWKCCNEVLLSDSSHLSSILGHWWITMNTTDTLKLRINKWKTGQIWNEAVPAASWRLRTLSHLWKFTYPAKWWEH